MPTPVTDVVTRPWAGRKSPRAVYINTPMNPKSSEVSFKTSTVTTTRMLSTGTRGIYNALATTVILSAGLFFTNRGTAGDRLLLKDPGFEETAPGGANPPNWT